MGAVVGPRVRADERDEPTATHGPYGEALRESAPPSSAPVTPWTRRAPPAFPGRRAGPRAALGNLGAAAETIIASYGAWAGHPSSGPETCTETLSMPRASSRSRADLASDGSLSTVTTSPAMRARTAAWYPLPVPISSTLSVALSPSASTMRATMYGWEMVWPSPIGSAMSS